MTWAWENDIKPQSSNTVHPKMIAVCYQSVESGFPFYSFFMTQKYEFLYNSAKYFYFTQTWNICNR